MVRGRSPTPAQGVSWDEAIASRPTGSRRSGGAWPGRDRRHHLVALHQRGGLCRPEDDPRRLRQQQCRYLRAGLPLPTGYGLKQTFGTSAGTQDFRSVDPGRRDPPDRRQPDRRASGLRQPHEEAAPAPGARIIVADPRRIDLVRSPISRRRTISSSARAHQCRDAERARPCDRYRGLVDRPSSPSAATGRVRRWRASSPRSATARGAGRSIGATRNPARSRRGSMPRAATGRSITGSA